MKKRKKILFCTEASFLPTGYSVYSKEVMSRLHCMPEFEVAELACYIDDNNPSIPSVPWKIYPNQPLQNGPDWGTYQSSPSFQFGEYKFNSVLLDFMPDFVVDIRDWWMIEFEARSPFRDLFHWSIMPTVDAFPQNPQWVSTYASANAVFTYSEFGRDTLLEQCDDIKYKGIASPCASANFKPVTNKVQHKESMGISGNIFLIGTVMRNQKRKLYPDLFRVFRKFLDETKAIDTYLYCHTCYPDVGWDIPRLLQEFDLTHRVLFTYQCNLCHEIQPNFFKDSFTFCKKCGKFSSHMAGINNKVEEDDFCKIYNLFDIYMQYANSEGFGMPQLEAAQCGVPVMSVEYSAMESVINNIKGIALKPLALNRECETGCYRAIPNNAGTVEKLIELYSNSDTLPAIGAKIRENTLVHYNWDKTAHVWAQHFHETKTLDHTQTWLSPPQIFTPDPTLPPQDISATDQTNYLFERVLGRPHWIGNFLWKRTVRDLTYQRMVESTHRDFYFNESHNITSSGTAASQPFNIEKAYKSFCDLRESFNMWEQTRHENIVRREL